MRLEWKDTAVEDLLTILSYIADENIETAQALKDLIDKRVSDLLGYPQMYKAGRVENTQWSFIRITLSYMLNMTMLSMSCAYFMLGNNGHKFITILVK